MRSLLAARCPLCLTVSWGFRGCQGSDLLCFWGVEAPLASNWGVAIISLTPAENRVMEQQRIVKWIIFGITLILAFQAAKLLAFAVYRMPDLAPGSAQVSLG